MVDKTNIQERINKATELKASLEKKLEKVVDTPREEEFKLQIEKIDDLISHLEDELNNLKEDE